MVDSTADPPPAIQGSNTPGSAAFVLFDVGGVLVDVDESLARSRWVELGYDEDRFAPAFHDSDAKVGGDLGDHDAEGMRHLVEIVAGSPVSRDAIVDIWGAMVAWRDWVPDVLGRLTVPYGVLSTIDPIHAGVLGDLPGASPVVYSFRLGLAKPDPRAFAFALARCPVAAAEVRYLDDRQENVDAATKLGMQAILVSDRASVEAALADLF